MAKKITFLGIETSCDETAAAVIQENNKGTADILSNMVSSQIEEHKKFGGVVPELAARAHLENIEYIIDSALKESKISIEKVDGIAATAGPGLIVCLTVGLNIGKSIAAFSNKPFFGVDAQIAYLIQEQAFDHLDAPIKRVSAIDVPQAYSKALESFQIPNHDRVLAKALELI